MGKAWPNDVQTQSNNTFFKSLLSSFFIKFKYSILTIYILDTYQEEIIQLLTDCLVKNTRITQVSVMVALKNLISKLNIIKKSSLTNEEEVILNAIMTNIEKAIQYAIGKC